MKLSAILLLNFLLAGSALAQPITVVLDAGKPGRNFDGLGAVSGWASSRLLIDYPEPQRGEISITCSSPTTGLRCSISKLK